MIESIESLKNNFVSKAEIMVSESEAYIKSMKESFESQSTNLKKSHKNILDSLKQELENNNKASSEQFLKMQ
jgi:outer membrane protein OmpA-like peptidoglycan-associated protein